MGEVPGTVSATGRPRRLLARTGVVQELSVGSELTIKSQLHPSNSLRNVLVLGQHGHFLGGAREKEVRPIPMQREKPGRVERLPLGTDNRLGGDRSQLERPTRLRDGIKEVRPIALNESQP